METVLAQTRNCFVNEDYVRQALLAKWTRTPLLELVSLPTRIHRGSLREIYAESEYTPVTFY